MQLPFFNKPNNEGKVFFGLFLKEQQGIGFLMRFDKSNIVLLDQEKFSYVHGWEHLAETVDEVILKLEQRSKTRLHETIFFIYSHFIDAKSKEIKKVYLDKIKDLVKRLNLKALGYIEAYEAVIHYLEKKEELPLTAVLIELDHSNLSVFVYKRGDLLYSRVLAHTNNLIDDLLTSFTEIKGRFVLPSRIILYNSKDLDNESTEIVTHRWSEELFVQLPRVEIIKEHDLIQGLLGVFAGQYGKKAAENALTESKPKEEVMGFVVGEDVAQMKPPVEEEIEQPVLSPSKAGSPFDLFAKTADSFFKFFSGIPKTFNKRWTIFVGIFLILLGIFLNEYFLHRSTLTLLLPTQSISKDLDISSDSLKVETGSKVIELKDTKATTGKKEIGEKAKGSVTIHNFDDSEKTFVKGTSLDTGGIKFVLDQEVKVASASVITINGGLVKQPGKTKVSIVADQLGPQGNVSSGKQFKISDFATSLYFGLNESALTGGTKKEVRTTSKKDLDDLRKSIVELAKKQNAEEEKNKKSSDVKILDQLTEIDLAKEKFDKEVGEEADSLSLEAEAKITSYSYKDEDLKNLILEVLKKDLQTGYELKKEKLTYQVKDIDEKGKEIILNVSSDAKAVKEVSNEKIIKAVKGKNVSEIENILIKNFKIDGFELEVKPKIPLLQNFLPLFEKNIIIKTSSL